LDSWALEIGARWCPCNWYHSWSYLLCYFTAIQGTNSDNQKEETKEEEKVSVRIRGIHSSRYNSLILEASTPIEEPKVVSEDVTKQALEAKTLGNQLYSQKKFEEAAEQYTKAISLSPTAIFYCNRAACYSNLQKFELALQDCNDAIRLDPKYAKAFHRRALAFEKLGQKQEALNDHTIVGALEKFRNQDSLNSVDRLLKDIATEKTKEIMASKVPAMPSPSFITAYMDSFRAQPSDAKVVAGLETANKSDLELKKTFEFSTARKWQESFDSCIAAIDADDFSDDTIKAKAYNFRGTLEFLRGQVDEAQSALEKALELDPNSVNTLIKRGTLYMEKGEVEKTIELFTKAETVGPKHPDLFYHRGQVRFLTGDYQGALDDYNASVNNESKDESSVYVHIQLGVSKYKLGDITGAEKKFREAKKKFPESAEVWNYHGEIYMDRGSFDEALKCFDKAAEMDPGSPLPYINKAMLVQTWKEDTEHAISLLEKAIEIDPLCELAYQQLAQFFFMQNKSEKAFKVFNQAVTIARTEAEVFNLILNMETARAQLHAVTVKFV
jgi:import receptor subunit TOM70